jgi:hypothetical protein
MPDCDLIDVPYLIDVPFDEEHPTHFYHEHGFSQPKVRKGALRRQAPAALIVLLSHEGKHELTTR